MWLAMMRSYGPRSGTVNTSPSMKSVRPHRPSRSTLSAVRLRTLAQSSRVARAVGCCAATVSESRPLPHATSRISKFSRSALHFRQGRRWPGHRVLQARYSRVRRSPRRHVPVFRRAVREGFLHYARPRPGADDWSTPSPERECRAVRPCSVGRPVTRKASAIGERRYAPSSRSSSLNAASASSRIRVPRSSASIAVAIALDSGLAVGDVVEDPQLHTCLQDRRHLETLDHLEKRFRRGGNDGLVGGKCLTGHSVLLDA